MTPLISRLLIVLIVLTARCDAVEQHDNFDVVIAGGSTAAFAAAVSAAQCDKRVALLEPTDWVGGQLTSSGVPAIDEAWHKLRDPHGQVTMDVAQIAQTPANISPLLRTFLSQTGCPGKCWVSRFCFEPRPFLEQHLVPLENSLANLSVFRETVVTRADTHRDRIVGIHAIQRFPRRGLSANGYDRLPSKEIPDWYASADSLRFTKKALHFTGHQVVFIDATEWGELLALADAPYLQGVEQKDGGLGGDETVGQSITFGFVQELHPKADPSLDVDVRRHQVDHLGFGDYEERENAWELVWRYRRLRATGQEVAPGDLSLQNWGYYVARHEGGNDYPFGYLFLDRKQTREQVANRWQGGVDLSVMSAAEQREFAWHHWFKSRAPQSIDPNRISLARHVLGTGHGLSKLPYIRDTRRSIGIDKFILQVSDLQPVGRGQLAKQFKDRIALGAYPVDIHPLADRSYPGYIDQPYDIAPFTIPFRALTNDRFDNLLVAGKTMAQSFLANSATRLHPTEWSTGTAAGVAAAMMSQRKLTAREMLKSIPELQRQVEQRTPINWTRPQ